MHFIYIFQYFLIYFIYSTIKQSALKYLIKLSFVFVLHKNIIYKTLHEIFFTAVHSLIRQNKELCIM